MYIPYDHGYTKALNLIDFNNNPANINGNLLTLKDNRTTLSTDRFVNFFDYHLVSKIKFVNAERFGESGFDFWVADEKNYFRLSFKPSESKILISQFVDGKINILKTKSTTLEMNKDYSIVLTAKRNGEIYAQIDGSRIFWDDQADIIKADPKYAKGGIAFFSYLAETSFDGLKIFPNDPPYIWDISYETLGHGEVVVKFKSSYPVLAEVVYDNSSHHSDNFASSYKYRTGTFEPVREGKILIRNLSPSNIYFFRIKAVSELTSISNEFTITMPEVKGAIAPKNDAPFVNFTLSVISFLATAIGLILFFKAQKRDLRPEAEQPSDYSLKAITNDLKNDSGLILKELSHIKQNSNKQNNNWDIFKKNDE
ncbi:MAG: hypothetical protein UT66_C0014G0017 [candidate division CPR2 bacterium GW2011_GWC1_39_9]|uniref:Uncharacterized protein n=1 Tax=candidate division CPR2 bacterium GW2011_GWC2_39_10 TaxID=1618345 RepID=A0A0G0LTI1_UNCC2|nr:MAG: hypothetical protein UT18_C0002G0020 [candidate division CPR2 bacterium GW2011_GWC2_39_10]KKR34942.1 MAG: hypothetical protein UT66_C0014G0017 [candidate division CPR2 bacterium GW2011_GWC1_39_9]